MPWFQRFSLIPHIEGKAQRYPIQITIQIIHTNNTDPLSISLIYTDIHTDLCTDLYTDKHTDKHNHISNT